MNRQIPYCHTLDDFIIANNVMLAAILPGTLQTSGHRYRPVVGRFHHLLNYSFLLIRASYFCHSASLSDLDHLL